MTENGEEEDERRRTAMTGQRRVDGEEDSRTRARRGTRIVMSLGHPG
jgi:hypothetical protein